MQTHRKELIEMMFKGMVDNYNKFFTKPFIWLNKPIWTDKEETRRIVSGDLVKVENGQLVSCRGNPNCKIIECLGNLSENRIKLLHLSTNQEYTITVL